jgi:hypothetical protein
VLGLNFCHEGRCASCCCHACCRCVAVRGGTACVEVGWPHLNAYSPAPVRPFSRPPTPL